MKELRVQLSDDDHRAMMLLLAVWEEIQDGGESPAIRRLRLTDPFMVRTLQAAAHLLHYVKENTR